MTGSRLRRKITKADATMVIAVRGALQRLDHSRLDEFVKNRPSAQVQDVADAFLAGIVLERTGPTGHGHQSVYEQLRAARKRLGLSPPMSHSVARHR
jgi:hypothetical protein